MSNTINPNRYYQQILDNDVVDEKILSFATHWKGMTVDVMNDVIYVETGYRSLKQFLEAER